jgi:hypothetical protein
LNVRRLLKKIPGAASCWRLLKRIFPAARYYVPRLIGYATYPLLGRRVPLRGYYVSTRDSLERTSGYCVSPEPPSSTDEITSTDTFKPDTFVAVIPKGRSLYDCGVVVSPDHRLLADVSWQGYGLISEPQQHPAMYELFLPPIKHIPGRVAVITSAKPDNYYHWMFDILPRFEIVQKSGLVSDYYLINATTQFQKDSLQVLNIPSHQIISPTHNTHIEADELIVPSLLGPVFNVSPQPRACRYLRSTFLQSAGTRKPHRALYITRADASIRRVINEAEIREEVIANGFEIVSLSDVPLLQQVEIFSEAKIIVGPHGAGFTNAVFCEPGVVLVEFLPQWHQIDCFKRLADFVGMEYRSIEGVQRGDSTAQMSESDYTVDRAALRGLLRQLV